MSAEVTGCLSRVFRGCLFGSGGVALRSPCDFPLL